MKKKILLFISLVLLAFPGHTATGSGMMLTSQIEQFSATVGQSDSHLVVANFDTDNPDDPVDNASRYNPLDTHTTTGDTTKLWNSGELSDEIILPNGVKPNGVYNDIPHLKNPGLVSAIVSFVQSFAPTIHIDELYENETFNDITAGTSATKTYMVWGHNVYNLAEEARSLNSQPGFAEAIPTGAKISLKIKLRLNGCIIDITPGTYAPVADDIFYSNPKMFTVNPSLFRPFDIDLDEGGDRMPLTVTFNPTTAGLYQFRFQAMIEFYVNDIYMPEWLTYIPILFLGEQELHTGSAVERTITTSEDLLDFETVIKGEAKPKTFTVKGTNLAGDLTLSIDNSNYTVEPSSISAEDAANDVPVTVTYHPTEEGCHDATLLISGGKAIEVPINLKGTCVVPTITISENSLSFGPIVNGQSSSKTFTIEGSYLTSDLILYTTNSIFSVNPKRITPEEASNGATVTVSYAPTTVGTQNAILHISGGGVENGPIDVNLSGSCVTNQTITVNPPSHNFGTVNAGTTNTATFTVKGTNLNDPITVVSPYEEGFTFSPETLPATGGKVTVTFKPTSEGSYSQEITLSSGDAFAKINVEGNCVIPPTIKTDVSSLDFGTVVKGKYARKTLTVTGVNLTSDLTLTSNRPYFTVSPTTITAAEATVGKTVTVTYSPTAGGDHSATLTISGGGADSIPVSLTGKCAAIDVTPSSYDFGTVKEGTTNTATFTVTGTNLSDRIVLAWPQEDGFTVSPTDLPASGGKVTVTFKPTSGGDYSQQYTLSSGNASAKITVNGKCAAVTTNKSALYFGTLRKNQTKTLDFTVTGVNVTHDLTLTSSNSTLFELNPTTITAAQAKAGKKVTVTYKPTACNDHSGTITISGQDIKSKTVSLSGKCANITVSPSSYDFGTKTKGQTYTKVFTVTGTNLSQRISIVSTDGEGFTVSPTDLPATGGTVTVTFKPTSAGSSYSQEFNCSSDLTTTFSVTGKCGTPSISVNPSSLHFTTASSQTLTVTGYYLTGNITLKSNQAPFTVSPTTLPSSGGTVTVTCNANSLLNSANGSITIKSDGATTRTVTLTYQAGSGPLEIGSAKPDDEQENNINGGELEISTIRSGVIGSNVNELEMNSKIYADKLSIIIESPIEQKAVISDIAGHIKEVDLQAGRNEIPVNAIGVYIVRIREKTTKLMLK